MNLNLHLPPEIEAKLLDEARATGKDPAEIVLHALDEQLSLSSPTPPRLSVEEWVADICAWAQSHRPLPREADDSRESIYAGRGE